MDINYDKIGFDFAVEWHFRDGVPEEWYDLQTEEEFNKAFDDMPAMIDDALLIVEHWLEDKTSDEVATLTWELYNFTRSNFASVVRECELRV